MAKIDAAGRRVIALLSPADLDAAVRAFEKHGENARLESAGERISPGRQANLSDTLTSFARPLLDSLPKPSIEATTQAMQFSALAWNAAIWGDEAIGEIRADLAARGFAASSLGLFDDLIERKRAYYAHDGRGIASVKTEAIPGGYHVSVMAAAQLARLAASHSVHEVLGSWDDPHHQCHCDDHPWAQGFTVDDLPDLLALAAQWGGPGNDARPADDPRFWAPFNAWRVLLDLGDPAAIPVMLARLDDLVDLEHEWGPPELVLLSGRVGAEAVPHLISFLEQSSHDPSARGWVCEALGAVAIGHPAARDEAVAALARELAACDRQDPAYNALVVAALAASQAAEHEALISRAFGAGRVDESICGSLRNVLAELRGERTDLAPLPGAGRALAAGRSPDRGAKAKEKARAKRKQEKAARKRARRR